MDFGLRGEIKEIKFNKGISIAFLSPPLSSLPLMRA
jgi:hypothetical protein